MSGSKKLRILIVPLDWGLGHTTRCMPIIDELLKNNVDVVLAGNELQKKILKAEYPKCDFLYLEGYNVKYAKRKNRFLLKMMLQSSDILSAIKKENKWLKKIVAENKIDGIISDNRFGLYHTAIPSIFITHQLQIKTAVGSLADKIARSVNYKYINKFSGCWVPDFEGAKNLAGELSHPNKMPTISCTYVGPLSRMSSDKLVSNNNNNILCILSGPEPQRTIFEQVILNQIRDCDANFTIVRGLPLQTDLPVIKNTILYNHLPKRELQRMMERAAFVICRSGYSSVMDINALKVKSILVPTPGQAEQEYLAKHLTENGFALCCNQASFKLQPMLTRARTFMYDGFVPTNPDTLSKAVAAYVERCSKNGQ